MPVFLSIHPKRYIPSFFKKSFFIDFKEKRKENCPEIDQRNNDTMLELTFKFYFHI